MSAEPTSTTVQPYGVELHYATTPEQWATVAARFELDIEDAPRSWGLTIRTTDTERERTHLVVWVDGAAHAHTDPVVLLGTLVHEGYHAAGAILDHVGQQYDGNSEAAAYLVDWLVQWLAQHTPGLDITREG